MHLHLSLSLAGSVGVTIHPSIHPSILPRRPVFLYYHFFAYSHMQYTFVETDTITSGGKKQLGDPTAYGYPPCPAIVGAIVRAMSNPDESPNAGYANVS